MTETAEKKKLEFNPELDDYYKNKNFSFYLFPLSNEKSYKSLLALYKFVLKQQDYWSQCPQGKTGQIVNHFKQIVNLIESANYHANTPNTPLQNAKNSLENALEMLNRNSFPCVFISSEADIIKAQYQVHYEQADAVCEYLFPPNGSNLNINWANKNHINGILQAYFFKNPNLQNNSFKSIDDSLNSLMERAVNSLNTADEQYTEKKDQVINEYNDFKNSIENWKREIDDSTQSLINEQTKKLEDLTNLYEEKLKLEAPAKYWEDTSKEYERKGKNWIWAILVFSTAFIGLLSYLLFELPDNKAALNFTSLKMSILLTVIISAGLLLLNLFIKLSTSAFHLSRDAAERNKLAYVYLALLKEKGVEETDRTVVLQSLFSRSDTGLLKGDSSPTIPDGLISQAIKSFTQHK